MDVLQHAVAVVGRGDAEVSFIAFAPGFGQVADGEFAFEQLQFKIEADHDVEIVGHFVGISADQRALDLVDGAVEHVERHVAELHGKSRLQLWVEVPPETTAAADEVLPES